MKQRELFDTAQSRLREGDMAGALRAAENGLVEFPEDANLMCIAVRAAIVLRRFDAARAYADTAVARYPDFPLAHEVLGDLRLVQGEASNAIEAYEAAQRLQPGRQDIAAKLDRAGQMLEASMAASGVAGGRPNRRQSAFAEQIRDALDHEKRGELDKAETIYRDILRADPDHIEACRLLAGIAAGDLANVLRHLEEYDEATVAANRVVELAPQMAEAHMLLASVVGSAGRHEEAIGIYERVLALDPEKAGAMCSLGHHLKTIGRQQEAISRYRECIAIRPDHAEAYWSLANLKTFRFEDTEIEAMQSLLDRDDLPPESRAQICNALGFHFEAARDFDRAFGYFEQCNITRRQAESYDPVDTEDTTGRVIEMFTEAFLRQPGGPDVQPTPIFVVGLPRSGSTLIEQILASHSQVEGTHELTDLSKTVRDMRQRAPQPARFPEALAALNTAGWAKIGRTYIERTEKHRKGAAFFIDKNPNNFIFTGLIRLAMPNAKIINARRHPLDSCLGSYKQLFASGQPFSYDLTELGEYYLQYQRIMDHWHAVSPGFVLDVRYEDVVRDLETEVRRMLDFCGLGFEESCLRFFDTERAVKTASSEQVRKPIYSSSIDLWRNYDKHLDELVEILAPLLPPPSDSALIPR